MLRALRFITGAVLLLFERLCGPKTLVEIKRPDHALGSLRGMTLRGFEVAIYCHRKEYRVLYENWYIPNRTLFSYNVFSVVGKDAPESLRSACELDVELPPLAHHRSFNSAIQRQQVHAYLDLLESRLIDRSKNETQK
jgi:hypothetical protein